VVGIRYGIVDRLLVKDIWVDLVSLHAFEDSRRY